MLKDHKERFLAAVAGLLALTAPIVWAPAPAAAAGTQDAVSPEADRPPTGAARHHCT
ncbi:hypothetical protein [Nonomuraea helvata]|uniref:hypothetical protein n=1 Tax=Nonomuraea helvata TaxID=37484 RepID=UPI0031E900A2